MTTENTPIPGALNNVIRIDDEQIKGHLDRIVRSTVEETLNALLQSEADRLCNAQRYERTEARRDTRAGHYERNLQTKAGEVTLKVPKLRRQTFETAIIERYRRREASVEEASKSPSNVLPMWPGYPSTGLPEGASLTAQGRIPEIDISSHVAAFVRQRLETSNGSFPGRGRTARGIRGLVRDAEPQAACQSLQPGSKRLATTSGRAAVSSAIAVCGLRPSRSARAKIPRPCAVNNVCFVGPEIARTDRQWTGTER